MLTDPLKYYWGLHCYQKVVKGPINMLMGDHTVNRRWSELLTDYSIVLTENSINGQTENTDYRGVGPFGYPT